MTDGYWDYAVVRSIYWGLTFDNTLPESIVVGIGYAGENLDYGKLRGTDLSPPLRMNMPFDPTPTVGEVDQFLSVIEKQAIPLIEREYRVDSQHRVLVGGSLGGLFTLYALFTRPHLFQGYVAASPSVIFVWPYEGEFARSKQTINAPVFMSVGGMDVFNDRSQRT